MCGRYALTFEDIEELESFLHARDTGMLLPTPNRPGWQSDIYFGNYNVAPSQEVPVACRTEEGQAVIDRMYWGFMGWKPAKGKKAFTPINTRDDKILESRMWRAPFLSKRCIVPANGFYEWAGTKGNKTPHYIYPKEGRFFGFAGIYSDLAPESSETRRSFSIITTAPNALMEPIHDRMPVILHPEEFDDWLNPEHTDPAYLQDFLQPYPDDAMQEHRVSKAVGNVRNNEPGLIEKADLFG